MIITLLTDYGHKDPYVAQMKGVILGICPKVRIVDITHDVLPQNVEQGAFLLYTTVPYFPEHTIHVAVVDPGVGTERRGLVVDCNDCVLIGPDNGLLLPAAKRKGNFRVYEITNREFFLDKITNTFHGRDIFAPVAAHIARGVNVKNVGREIDDYADLDLDFGKIIDGRVEGKVVHIDRFGNLITSIKEELLLDMLGYGELVNVMIGGRSLRLPFLKSYGYAKEGELLLTSGGCGFIEISMNMGSASERLGVRIGEKVILTL